MNERTNERSNNATATRLYTHTHTHFDEQKKSTSQSNRDALIDIHRCDERRACTTRTGATNRTVTIPGSGVGCGARDGTLVAVDLSMQTSMLMVV